MKTFCRIHLANNFWNLKYFISATDPQTTFFASALQEATVNAIESCKNFLQQILDVELPYIDPSRENIEKAIIILDLAIQNAGLFHESMSSVLNKLFHICNTCNDNKFTWKSNF